MAVKQPMETRGLKQGQVAEEEMAQLHQLEE